MTLVYVQEVGDPSGEEDVSQVLLAPGCVRDYHAFDIEDTHLLACDLHASETLGDECVHVSEGVGVTLTYPGAILTSLSDSRVFFQRNSCRCQN